MSEKVKSKIKEKKAIKTGRMGHQDTKLTFIRPRLKELNDIP